MINWSNGSDAILRVEDGGGESVSAQVAPNTMVAVRQTGPDTWVVVWEHRRWIRQAEEEYPSQAEAMRAAEATLEEFSRLGGGDFFYYMS